MAKRKNTPKGIIYPAGIAYTWDDMNVAVRRYLNKPDGFMNANSLVLKWNNLRAAILQLEARLK